MPKQYSEGLKKQAVAYYNSTHRKTPQVLMLKGITMFLSTTFLRKRKNPLKPFDFKGNGRTRHEAYECHALIRRQFH